MLHIVPCKYMQFRRICSKICRTQSSRTPPPLVAPPVPLPLLCFLLRKPVPTPLSPLKAPLKHRFDLLSYGPSDRCAVSISLYPQQAARSGKLKMDCSSVWKLKVEAGAGAPYRASSPAERDLAAALLLRDTKKGLRGSIYSKRSQASKGSSIIHRAGLSSALVELVPF